MNRRRCVRTRLWPYLRYYLGTSQDELRKSVGNLTLRETFCCRWCQPEPQKYETRVLHTNWTTTLLKDDIKMQITTKFEMCARLNCPGILPIGCIRGANFFPSVGIRNHEFGIKLQSGAKWCLLTLLLVVSRSSYSLALPVRILFLFDTNSSGKDSRTSQNEASFASGRMKCKSSKSVL